MEIGKAKIISFSELSNVLSLDKINMRRIINSLALNGLIIRSMKLEDRSYVKIILTTKGKEIYENIDKKIDRCFEKVFDTVPDEKKNQIAESIYIINRAVNHDNCC